jgi:hypothetical protein
MAEKSIGKENFAIIISLLDEATELPSYENNPYEFCYVLE